jgi:hydrogenase maturation factor
VKQDVPLSAGKLPADALEAILSRLPAADARVVVGPRLGEDAAVIEMGDRYLVVAADPITFAYDRAGWYSVHVNANDVAVLGAQPRWFLAVLLLPEGTATTAMAEAITSDIGETCHLLGVSLCGGHTEVTVGLDRPIVIGQMMGEVEKDRLVRKDSLATGDRVLLTRGAAIEGTALLARERRKWLERRLGSPLVSRAQHLLFDPGISVVEAARTATEAGLVHAMHDPTEGGVATGLWELARSGGRGLCVQADRIPILPETAAVCSALGIDPLRLIASGALLIAAPSGEAPGVARALEERGIPVADVGEILESGEAIQIEVSGRRVPLEPAERDEIARVLGQ